MKSQYNKIIENKYWVYGLYFIFKPEFDESIEYYIGQLQFYKKLIFSNYMGYDCDSPLYCIYTHCTISTYHGSKFNQPINNYFCYLTHLEELYFGYNFNQPLDSAMYHLTKLTHLGLGVEFAQELELGPSIKVLTLDSNNHYQIDNLPSSIEQLNLGGYFNLPLDNLPNSIKKISFYNYSRYPNKLNNLPRSLELLELSSYYKNKIENLPPNCKVVYL